MDPHPDDITKLASLTRDIAVAMVTTKDEHDHFTACPMSHQEVEPDGTLWFYAERGSSIVANVAADPHLGITLSSASTWVSIDGEAVMVDDVQTKQALWTKEVEAWLPQGAESDDVVLLKVTGHTAEYWDSPGGRVTSVLSFVKSKVTGEPYEGTENEIVALSD